MLHYKQVASTHDVLTAFLLLLWWAVSREAPQLPNRLPLLTLLDGVQHTLQNLLAAAQVHGGTGGRAASVLGSLYVATAQQVTNTCGALNSQTESVAVLLSCCCALVTTTARHDACLHPTRCRGCVCQAVCGRQLYVQLLSAAGLLPVACCILHLDTALAAHTPAGGCHLSVKKRPLQTTPAAVSRLEAAQKPGRPAAFSKVILQEIVWPQAAAAAAAVAFGHNKFFHQSTTI